MTSYTIPSAVVAALRPIRCGLFLPLAAAGLAACTTGGPPPTPAVSILPGPGKDAAAFQQDEQVCQRHAIAHTGYADAAPAGADSPTNAPTQPFDEAGYAQCMASRGDTVQAQPNYAATSYGYAYGYPYPYASPYPFFDGGLYAGWGWGGWGYGGWRHGGWHGWHGGGWHGGGWHGGGHR